MALSTSRPPDTEKVTFLSNGSGGLEIIDTQANTSAYAGKVSGFGGVHGSNTVQFIDLVSVTFTGVVSESYSPTTTSSGVLTVTSGGTAVAKINLLGTGYTTSGFHLSSGPGGSGTIITDPPVVSGGTTQTTSASALIPPNSLDLSQIASGAPTTLAYSENGNTGGTLTVPGEAASIIALLGNYIAAGFTKEAQGTAGPLVSGAAQTEQLLLTHPPHG